MNKPIITIKKLKTFRGMDTLGYNANIYLDGIFVGMLIDDGGGGGANFEDNISYGDKPTPTDIIVEAKIEELKVWVESQPERDLNADNKFGDGIPLMHKDCIEDLMEEAVNDAINEKSFKKDSIKGVCYGKKHSYRKMIGWRGIDLVGVKNHPKMGIASIQKLYDDTKKTLKVGETILNEEYLKSLGVNL